MPMRSSAAVKRFATGTPPPFGVVTLTPLGAVVVVPGAYTGLLPLADVADVPSLASADASGAADSDVTVSAASLPAEVLDVDPLPPLHAIASITKARSNADKR